jgi:signal peptidase I
LTENDVPEGTGEVRAPQDSHDLPERMGRKRRKHRSFFRELPVLLGVSIVLALLVRAFLVQTFFIPSTSMVPTLQVGDRVLVNKLVYRFHGPGRGDIVVFSDKYTLDEPGMKSISQVCPSALGPEDLIKRVIGLPGDTVQGKDGHVYVNGQLLAEPYLAPGTATSSFGTVTVPAGHLFVMGDNRGDSCDSRIFGVIPESAVVGKAFVRIWPLGRLGGL